MTTSDWIQLSVGIVLSLTLVAVIWYAWETRKMAKATETLAKEAETQRLALYEPSIQPYVRHHPRNEMGSARFHEWEILFPNTGQGDAYQVEPTILLDRDPNYCEEAWTKGKHPANEPQRVTREPWPIIPIGASQDWGLDTLGSAKDYVVAAMYKDRIDRLFISGYGFRMEQDGMRPTKAIPPRLFKEAS